MTITLIYDEKIQTIKDVTEWYLSPQETQLVINLGDNLLKSYNLDKINVFEVSLQDTQ